MLGFEINQFEVGTCRLCGALVHLSWDERHAAWHERLTRLFQAAGVEQVEDAT